MNELKDTKEKEALTLSMTTVLNNKRAHPYTRV